MALVVGALAGCAPTGAASGTLTPAGRLAERLSGMIWPLPIERSFLMTSPFGWRGRRHHDGVDIDGDTGDPIHAAAPGRIRFSGRQRGYGQTIIIDHGNGVSTLYAHASTRYVRVGDAVSRGQPIGAVGATGNATGSHLHFEIRWAGRALDPVPLLPRLGD